MTERLTNLATSILTAPLTSGATSLTVNSPGKFPTSGNFRIRVDSEHIFVTTVGGSTLGGLTRGIEGTTAVAHLSGAEVRHVLTAVGLDTRVTETVGALKGTANGYASLDAAGKIPSIQLPAAVVEYKGAWNVSTNTPTLSDATGTLGDEYVVSTGGARNLGSGSITWSANDLAIHNGSVWQQVAAAGGVAGVSSVNTRSGAVVLVKGDVGLGSVDNTADTAKPVSTAQQTALDLKVDDADLALVGRRVLTTITGTPYTFALIDAGAVFDGNSACVLKIPALATTNFPEGSWIEVCNTQGLLVEIQSATGTMIETPLSATRVASVWIKPQYGSCRFRKRAAASDFWIASGDHSLT